MAGVRQTFLHRWAQAGAKTDPGDAKTDLGWIAEKPAYQFFNYILGRIDDMLAHFEEQAVPDWHTDTEYLIGGLAMGSDRLVYRAVQANTGNDPTVDGGTNWLPFIRTASTSVAGIVELANATETQAGTDNTLAVNPLGLSTLTADETRHGLARLATNGEGQALSELFRVLTPAVLGQINASTTQRGIIRMATSSEVITGTAADRAISPAAIGALAQTLASSGYKAFPGGLIIQWGSANFSNSLAFDVTLPIAYPNAHLQAIASHEMEDVSETQNGSGASPLSLTEVRLMTGQVTRTVRWISIGH